MKKISDDEFNETAKCCCGWYTEPCDGELVWCTNPANSNEDEGNCSKEYCPMLENIMEIAEARNDI